MIYEVAWIINVEADSPQEAAMEARILRDKRDEDRIDNQFYVTDKFFDTSHSISVDFDVIEERV